jgi:hypothetical protein
VSLKDNFSVKNAADAAGFYTDLYLDHLARDVANDGIGFVHAAPGMVATNWGSDIENAFVRGSAQTFLRCVGKAPADAGEFMTR